MDWQFRVAMVIMSIGTSISAFVALSWLIEVSNEYKRVMTIVTSLTTSSLFAITTLLVFYAIA